MGPWACSLSQNSEAARPSCRKPALPSGTSLGTTVPEEAEPTPGLPEGASQALERASGNRAIILYLIYPNSAGEQGGELRVGKLCLPWIQVSFLLWDNFRLTEKLQRQ